MVTEEQIHIITKAEMLKNVSYPSKEEPVSKGKGKYRLVFAKSTGTLKLVEMGDKPGVLEMKSLLATLKKPSKKDATGKQEYMTVTMKLNKNHSKRVAKLVNSLDPTEVELSSLYVTEIVALKNGKEVNIPGAFNINLD